MEITLFIFAITGSIAVLLSLENDFLRRNSLKAKRAEEDRIYRLSVIKEIQEKIVYMADPEKVVDIIMVSLRNLFAYSTAASMVIKDSHVVFKVYAEENVGPQYVKRVEKSMLSSFEKLIGKLPMRIEKKMYGKPIDNTFKSDYSSSFHIPLIANNKVLAFIHLSSTGVNTYSDMKGLHELIDAASSSLTHFGRAVDLETKKLSLLIANINNGIIMADNKNGLLTINSFAKKVLGATDNSTFSDILDIFPQSFNVKSKIDKVMSTKNPYFEREVPINDKALNIFINPVGNENVSIVLHDMTDYKRKESLKEDSIHIMIHELRSPITTIKDSAELLIRNNDISKTDEKLNFLQIIHHQAKKALGQIGSILDAAKLDAGKLVLQKTKGNIIKLIKDEIQTFRPRTERKNISLSFTVLAESLPSIFFDEIRISQVLDNILSNSLKFTPEGGKIKIELDYKVISPVSEDSSHGAYEKVLDKYVVVSVSDNGVGITPDQQKALFSKYTQAKNTSEEIATMGTGLGLYLVKGIVESHDGKVWVKSAQGQGTTLSFALPATDSSYDILKSATTPLAKLSQTVN